MGRKKLNTNNGRRREEITPHPCQLSFPNCRPQIWESEQSWVLWVAVTASLKEIFLCRRVSFCPSETKWCYGSLNKEDKRIFWLLAVRTGTSCTERLAVVGVSLRKDFTEAGGKGQRLLTSGAWGVTPFHFHLPLHILPGLLSIKHLHLRCHTHPCMRAGYTRGKQGVQQQKAGWSGRDWLIGSRNSLPKNNSK